LKTDRQTDRQKETPAESTKISVCSDHNPIEGLTIFNPAIYTQMGFEYGAVIASVNCNEVIYIYVCAKDPGLQFDV
jgi:hypothetical protein